MDRWVGKVAIVTGASSGIGAAIAEKLTRNGLKVVGLARRKERVDALAKKLSNASGQLHSIKCDVTSEQDILNAFKWTKDHLGPISILINNAGVYKSVMLTESPTQDFRHILDTNVVGLCVATREAAKSMMENKIDGHIIHISSVASQQVFFVGGGVYSASKYAVRALTEGLRKEFVEKKSKCKITSICPGAVDTEILQSAEIAGLFDLKTLPMLKSEDIADAVVYVLGTPPHVQIHDMAIKPIGEQF